MTPDPSPEASRALLQWPDLRWRWRRFQRLRVDELHDILAARQRVFSVEQECAFLDIDGCDERAAHLAAWSAAQREPLAYARLLDPGVKYVEASIGRVMTSAAARGAGLGREVFRRALARARSAWPELGVRISAQSRLEAFYQGFGFVAAGATYLEDGIAHTEMLLAPGVRRLRLQK
ncbi:MAG: GNAT family N-acetyltransferase [Pseudomonadota bacterium]|nr:GNAT family N-acetyltransferase [Pseudomonadota bacterium]